MSVYKQAEFKAFIRMIEKGQLQHWVQVAEVLGVDKNTIVAWKQLPEARQAIAKGINNSLNSMERVGKHDWRMWQAKLKMLGMPEKLEADTQLTTNPIQEILKAYGLLNQDGTPLDPSSFDNS